LSPRNYIPTVLEARDDGADESALKMIKLVPPSFKACRPLNISKMATASYLDTIRLDGNEAAGID
jgi:hypothetical protein